MLLSKPFRSPLRTKSNAVSESKEAVTPQTSGTTTFDTDLKEFASTHPKTHVVSTVDDVDKLQREYSALSLQLRKHRQDLDALEQASRIRKGKQQEKVDALTAKWKIICQDVAEDLFDSTSKQIQDMGGLRTWQQQAVQAPDTDWYDTKEDHSSQAASDLIEVDVEHEPVVQDRSSEDTPVSRSGPSELRWSVNQNTATFHNEHYAQSAQYRSRSSWLQCGHRAMVLVFQHFDQENPTPR